MGEGRTGGGGGMGVEAPSRSILLGSHLPADGRRKFLALEDQAGKTGAGTQLASLRFRGQQTVSGKAQKVHVSGFWPIWCLSQRLSSMGAA